MSTETVRASGHRAARRRFGALARAELKILSRSKVSLFYALAFGPLMVWVISLTPVVDALADLMPQGGLAAAIIAALTAMSLCTAIYYNLTTAFVARRESLTLKRLHAGESRPLEILTALAVPNLLVFGAQLVLLLAVSALIGMPRFTNPPLFALALVLGALFFTTLSYLTAAHTRTVESAQLTTMPGMLAGMLLSGLIIPVAALPGPAAQVLLSLPMAPVVDLALLGLNGTSLQGASHDFAGSWLAGGRSVLVLLAWCAVAVALLRRSLRWEPVR